MTEKGEIREKKFCLDATKPGIVDEIHHFPYSST